MKKRSANERRIAKVVFFKTLILALLLSPAAFSQAQILLVCNVMVNPEPSINPTAKFRVDQFLFEDPTKADGIVLWHPWGGARINMLAVPLQKTKIVAHRSESFPGAHTVTVIPDGTSFQFKLRLWQTPATGTDYSFIDAKYGTMDSTGEVREWLDFSLKDPSNRNEPGGGCRYNKLF